MEHGARGRALHPRSRCSSSAARCWRGRSTIRRRDRPDHLHRCALPPNGCGVWSASAGHVAVLAALADRRQTSGRSSTSPVSNRCRTRWPRCAGLPSVTGCAGGGRRVRATASSALDSALLDGEIALLTAAAQDYFADDTLDSDVAELLHAHRGSLVAGAQRRRPARRRTGRRVQRARRRNRRRRVAGSRCAAANPAERRRDDYALAAGRESVGPEPWRSPAASVRSTGPPFRPGSSTRPRAPSTG